MCPRRIAWLFPGQGTQTVGMGRALYERSPAARAVLAAADAAVGGGLLRRCFDGPAAALQLTVHAQPAIVAVSLAALAACREAAGGWDNSQAPAEVLATSAPSGLEAVYAAGHSVGELTALIAVGSLSLIEGMQLVQQRAHAMHEAGTANPSGMAAVLGLERPDVERACAAARAELPASYVTVATHNEPTQLVVAGDHAGVAAAGRHAKRLGARRVVPLAVSAGFHSAAMEPAAAVLATAVETAPIRPARLPVVLNTSAQPTRDPEVLRAELPVQVRQPVQWAGTVSFFLTNGVTAFLECGPGKVLTSGIRRSSFRGEGDVATWAVADPDEAAAAVAELSEGEGGQTA